MQHRAFFAENPSLVEQASLCQSNPNVDMPKVTYDDGDAKNDRSNGDIEKAELEKKAAALFNIVRALLDKLQFVIRIVIFVRTLQEL